MATGLHDRKLCGNLYRSDLVQRIHQLDYLCGHEYGSAVPKELDETAYLDGYSFWRFFLKIFLPIIAAGIGVVAFFCFMYSWVELLFAKTLTSVAAKPIAATMTRTASTAGYELGLLAAAGTLTIIPGAFVIYFVRHYIAKGFALGRVKARGGRAVDGVDLADRRLLPVHRRMPDGDGGMGALQPRRGAAQRDPRIGYDPRRSFVHLSAGQRVHIPRLAGVLRHAHVGRLCHLHRLRLRRIQVGMRRSGWGHDGSPVGLTRRDPHGSRRS